MTSTQFLIYVAHPLGPDGPQRVANIERAKRWLRWLVASYSDCAFEIGWLLYAQVLSETQENCARGMKDNERRLEGCDGIILVGGEKSPGMVAEEARANELQLELVDLTHLGPEPPKYAYDRSWGHEYP